MKNLTDIIPASSPSLSQPAPIIRHSSFVIRHSGFTFIEVLFAVIILGVGMIMIAGMLPVAIKQNAESRNDLTAKSVAENGFAYLKTLVQTHPEAFPPTNGTNTTDNKNSMNPDGNTLLEDFLEDKLMGLNQDDYTQNGSFPKNSSTATLRRAGRVVPLTLDVIYGGSKAPANKYKLTKASDTDRQNFPLMWQQSLIGDRLPTSDGRFQWLAFYRRDEGSSVIHLYIVAMRLQHTDPVNAYGQTTLAQEGINAPNGPFLVPIEVEDSLVEPDKVKFVATGNNPVDTLAADAGSFLIVAHSPPLNGNPDSDGSPGDLDRPFRNNGKIFRLGARRDDLDTTAGGARVWDLQPGYDLPSADAGIDGIRGTPDDTPDGSMNTTASLDQTDRPSTSNSPKDYVAARRIVNNGNKKSVSGTTTWAWLIGRGRIDPSSPTDARFVGTTQDLAVMSVDVTLP